MTEAKATKKKQRKPEQRDKEELIQTLSKAFQEAPEDLWAFYPALAAKLDRLIRVKKPASDSDSLHYSYLPERERDFRLSRLASIIGRWEVTGISKDEAMEALEQAAALHEQSSAYKDALLAILEKTLEFPLDSKEVRTAYFQKGEPEHHTYTLARGVTLSLTWDRKLIKIVFDPTEYSLRQKALSFVGTGSDKNRDVARRHDFYLEDSFGR